MKYLSPEIEQKYIMAKLLSLAINKMNLMSKVHLPYLTGVNQC